MTDMTHYERATRKVESFRPRARQLIETAWPSIQKDPIGFLDHWTVQELERCQTFRDTTVASQRGMVLIHEIVRAILRDSGSYSYDVLTARDDFGQMIATIMGVDSAITKQSRQEILNTGGQMIYQMAAHDLCGKRVYEVSPGLADKLMATEVRGLQTNDLRLPFESIYITAPRVTSLQIFNGDTGWHRVEGIYITEDHDDDGTRMWRFMVSGEAKPLKIQGVDFDNDALVYWRMRLPDDLDLQDAIEATTNHMIESLVVHKTTFKEMVPVWTEIFRYCMAVILYSTWPDCDREDVAVNREFRQLYQRIGKLPAKSKKRAALQRKLQAIEPRRRTVLGGSITIDRSRPGSEDSTGRGRPLEVLQRVAGHFKMVAHGPGRAQRRPHFVEPYYRGPEDGPLGTAVHRLKNGKGDG